MKNCASLFFERIQSVAEDPRVVAWFAGSDPYNRMTVVDERGPAQPLVKGRETISGEKIFCFPNPQVACTC
jgi:hypothetical protein